MIKTTVMPLHKAWPHLKVGMLIAWKNNKEEVEEQTATDRIYCLKHNEDVLYSKDVLYIEREGWNGGQCDDCWTKNLKGTWAIGKEEKYWVKFTEDIAPIKIKGNNLTSMKKALKLNV